MNRPFRSPLLILFDFDGTLADSYECITSSVNFVRVQNNLHQLSQDDVRQIAASGGDLLAKAVPAGEYHKNVDIYSAHYKGTMLTQTTIFESTVPVLSAIRSARIKIGLCSNKRFEFMKDLIGHFKLDSYFDIVVGPDSHLAPKPDPSMLQHCLNILGVSACDAIYVGDMDVDTLAANAAGIRAWIIPERGASVASTLNYEPDRLLKGLEDILEAI